jgi:ADP-heptose:LPS heptosyltransferase
MAAVALSSVHLAADTGTGHIAAAYGTPVVSVFGPTQPQNYRPYTDRGIVLRGPEDTTNVPPDDVLAAALKLASHAQLPH